MSVSGSDPTFLGGYEVVRTLGRGDFAVVHEVIDPNDGAHYAIKQAHDSREAVLRLEAEVLALSILDHPGVPRLIAQSVDRHKPYLVMSLLPGEPLRTGLEERARRNSLYSDIETLAVVEGLLEILAHLRHAGNLVHRDIKSANVLVRLSDLRPYLLDFGFAKEHGSSGIRTGDSFHRAGAPRYCPPSKLNHPGRADRAHDVFAIGVLAYEMLTGRYPWSASVTGARDELLELYRGPSAPVRDIQPLVRPEVARFVDSLLDLHDETRPSVAAALAEASDLRKSLQPRLPDNYPLNVPLSYPRVLRDPIHRDIRLTEYEWQILRTPQMQRLRWIRQLGLTNLVYHGAEHSRLSHSLGTLFRVEQILRSIEDCEGIRFDSETRIMARLYALVHDVTHVAFGHTLEDELGFFGRHDKNVARIERLVLGSELGELLHQNEMGRNVRSLFDSDSTITLQGGIVDVVTGSAGADVLDYIDRDSFHCGLDHRIDSAIFRQLRIETDSRKSDGGVFSLLYSRHGPRIDREFAIENLFRERYALFLKVYAHPRKLAAAAVLDKGVSDVVDGTVARRSRLREEALEQMPDDVLIHWLSSSNRQTPARVGRMITRRNLPVPVFRAPLLGESPTADAYQAKRGELSAQGALDHQGRRLLEASLAREARVNSDDVFIYVSPSPPGYKRLEHWVASEVGRRGRRDAAHEPFAEVRRAHLKLWEVWVYYGGEDVDRDQAAARLASATSHRFGRENRIDFPVREDRLF